jgi:hypothetical protein
MSYRHAGRYQDAIQVWKIVLGRAQTGEYPLWVPHSNLAITYAMMDQNENARIHLAETLRSNPGYSLQFVRRVTFFRDPIDLERMVEPLRKLGLPEKSASTAR